MQNWEIFVKIQTKLSMFIISVYWPWCLELLSEIVSVQKLRDCPYWKRPRWAWYWNCLSAICLMWRFENRSLKVLSQLIVFFESYVLWLKILTDWNGSYKSLWRRKINRLNWTFIKIWLSRQCSRNKSNPCWLIIERILDKIRSKFHLINQCQSLPQLQFLFLSYSQSWFLFQLISSRPL